MSVEFTEDDRQIVKREIERTAAEWSQAGFLEECERLARRVIPNNQQAANEVAKITAENLAKKNPFAMIRVGEGEGNVLAMSPDFPGDTSGTEKKFFDALMILQDEKTMELDEARSFASRMEESILQADVLGIRPLVLKMKPELELAREFLQIDVRGSMGIVRSVQFVANLVRSGRLSERTLVPAWIHLTLLPHLSKLMKAASEVVVVSGREELRDEFARRSGDTPVEFLAIPLEAARAVDRTSRHYPERYQDILSRLAEPGPGRLVLVGAGTFAKAYCATARSAGSVALDLGSGFDLLAGARTRPVHHWIAAETIKRLSWVKA